MKFDNILVPYDGSECAERAFNTALDLAKFTNSAITITTCVEPTYSSDMGVDPEFVDKEEIELKNEALNNMRKLTKKGEKNGIKIVEEVIKAISIPEKLEEISDSTKVDLIIMGSHGRTGFKKFVFGNVTNKLAPICKCSIMIVK
jgi:nucleotide-binding universal stress UspA family protein